MTTRLNSMEQYHLRLREHRFAPGLVGTFSGGEVGGDGCHDPSPSINGNMSWRGSSGACCRRWLSEGRRRFAPCETSRSIGQALSLGADQRTISAGYIVDAKRDPVVVAEIELGRVAMQVRLADVEIAAVDPALEDAKKVFDRVGVPERGAHIFLGAVVHRAVATEIAADRGINRSVIGHQVGGLVDVRDDDRLQGLRGHVLDMKAADPAVALYQRQHRGLWRDDVLPIASLAADESFVCLDNLVCAAERASVEKVQLGHRLADAVSEEPRGFQPALKGP